MITIQERALKYAKKIQGNFLIRTSTKNVTCWSGNDTKVVNLRVEIIKHFRKEEIYDEYEYDGVKIYILNSLILKEDVYIFMFPKIPFMQPICNVRGIEIKRY